MDSLIQKILAGDKVAIRQFYNTYSQKLQRYFLKRLPPSEDIESFSNDVLLSAIDSLILFEGKSSFTTWLYRIAHHKLVDFYRKKKVKSLLLSQIPFLEIIAHEVYEPEFQYEKNKLRDKIEFTLRHISQRYRTILQLYYEEERSVKEIAALLQISHKAAESLLFRARKEFQKKYAKE